MSAQTVPRIHTEFSSLATKAPDEEKDLTPLQRLLACRKQRDPSLPQNEPSELSQVLLESDSPVEDRFKPLETSFYEEALHPDSNSMVSMKQYLQFTRIKRDLAQRVLDGNTLHTFLTTCRLSEFDQFDCDILTFSPTRSKEETMLTLCRSFCDHVHHHGFPMEAEEANYHLALIRLYAERHPKMALAVVSGNLQLAINATARAISMKEGNGDKMN